MLLCNALLFENVFHSFIHLHCFNEAFLFLCLYAANQRIVWNAMQHSVRFKILYLFLWWVDCVQVHWMKKCSLIIWCECGGCVGLCSRHERFTLNKLWGLLIPGVWSSCYKCQLQYGSHLTGWFIWNPIGGLTGFVHVFSLGLQRASVNVCNLCD